MLFLNGMIQLEDAIQPCVWLSVCVCSLDDDDEELLDVIDSCVYLSVRFSVCLCVSQSVCLFLSLSVCLAVSLRVPVYVCNLASWSNCCSVPKIGIFAEEGPQNYPSHCIWHAIWFCMCICWGRTRFCTKVWFGKKNFLHSYKCWQLFTRPSSPMTRLRYYFSTLTTYRLSHTTNKN